MKCILESCVDTPLVSFYISNQRGTACEPFGAEGLVAHTAELSFRGCGELTRNDFDERVDSLGAGLGIGTRRDYLSLRGTCLVRHLDSLFDLAIAALCQPRMEQAEHEQLVRETRYELDDLRDDDASLAHRFFNRSVHPGHIYCRTALGTEESLSSFTLEASRALHRQLFRREDLVLGIAGPVDQSRIEQLAKRIESNDATALPAPNLQPPPAMPGRRLILVDKPNREQCQVVMGHLAPTWGSEAHDRLHVAETAFGGMFTSRLMQEIRVKKGWSYGAQCMMHRALGSHALQISLAPGADVCAPAIERTLELFSELQDKGLTQEEFLFTKSYLQGSSAFERATPNQRLFRKIQEEIHQLPAGFGDQYTQRLDTMNLKQINHACAEHLHPRDLCVVVVATADTMLAKLEALGWTSIEVVAFDSY